MYTKIEYIDMETAEVLIIPKHELNNYEIKLIEITYEKDKWNTTKIIRKSAKKSGQFKIEWDV